MLPSVRFGLLSVLALAASAGISHAQVEVQVGYADNIRASPFFPMPWFGGPGVDLFSDPLGNAESYDAGAVRVINKGMSNVTIEGLVVDSFEDGSSHEIWDSLLPFVLKPGKSAIFTQTVCCDFDSSDFPIHGLPGSSAMPVVHLTIDGVTADLVDTAQVLNTEGSDHLAQAGLNESHQWRDIGTFGGQAGVPEPGTLILATIGLLGMAGMKACKRRTRKV